MAKGHQDQDYRGIRVFRTVPNAGFTELPDTGFDDERHLHALIERNIGTLFQHLTFLKGEFRELDEGRHIPDTVAFDSERNTFVVIEYKNKMDRGVVDQAKAYLETMKERKQVLAAAYHNARRGKLDPKSYNWDVYAIVMAPEFTQNQITGSRMDTSLELHEIRQYGDGVMTVRRAGGGHAGSPARAKPHSKPASFKPSSPGHLDKEIQNRIRAEFPGSVVNEKPKYYSGFYYPGHGYFCTVVPQKSKAWLLYSGSHATSTLKPDGFVQAIPGGKGHGVGKYRSEIRGEADLARAVAILKRLNATNPRQILTTEEEMRITSAKHKPGTPPPTALICPDATISLDSWSGVLVEVAKWLIEKGMLEASNCPVSLRHGDILLNTEPRRRNGKLFLHKRDVGGLFLNMNGASTRSIQYAVRLIEAAGQNPDGFKLRFEEVS